jgi:hypothetical protein
MKVARNAAFRSERSDDWTSERIAQLSVQDIKQLRENAERLNESGVAALCSEALAKRRDRVPAARKSGATTKPRHLVPRTRAFEARGVWIRDARTSWGGVRKSDGAVVVALWADAIECASGGCSYLLWAPNINGSRPWSDQPGGIERLDHCKRALELGRAEGLLVYGERLVDRIPEDRARAIHGADPQTVIVFEVEQRGEEFWARWGKKAAATVGS